MHSIKTKTVVILGAGFAGISTALSLCKKLRGGANYKILLIDSRLVHIYTPDLYEIATAFHEKITEECLTQLKDTVAIPIKKILRDFPVEFIRDTVTGIHPAEKIVTLQNYGTLHYTYLVVALGSMVNYYNIPGLEHFSYPFKTLTDSIAINCHIDHYLQTFWKHDEQKRISIVIGGGGATGVEFACELPGYIEKLCRKYRYQRSTIDITLIEATPNLTGQGEKITKIILKRLNTLGINVLLNTFIKEVTADEISVETNDKKRKIIPRDILIWTGGVMPHPLIRASFQDVAKNGALPVNELLQYEKFPQIYASGDNAAFIDTKRGIPAPMLAQIAIQQGDLIAHNIAADIEGKTKKAYRLKLKGIIIPLGGQYALVKIGNLVFRGFFVWILRRIVDLWYALRILPFWYALKKWLHDTRVFVEND